MAKRAVEARLRDILNAMDELHEILDGADLGTYQRSLLMRRAAERCLEIISEASRYIPDAMTARHPEVAWPEIRAIGNVLRHRYQVVADHVIWRTATKSVGELRPIITELLNSSPEGC